MNHSFIFRVTLANPDSDPFDYLESLHREGCEDATLGVRRLGFLALDFTRKAESLPLALASAHAAVQRAIPDAVGIEMVWG